MRSLRVVGVTKRFERTVALRSVSLSLEPASCLVLLGANGAGKSTLMGILSTRVRPTRGDVIYDDCPWARVGPVERARIGLLAHGSLLYADLTGYENLRFYARIFRLANPEARIEEVLREVDMLDERDRRVRTCSRGMLQRLSLARALLHRPSLLLLDEPFTGLDQPSTDRLLTTLAGYRERGCMLVIVTHHPRQVASLCDRIVVLERGCVVHDQPFDGQVPVVG